MEMYTRVNGKMIRHMEKVSTLMLMDQDMKENGLKTNNMVLVLKDGLMVHLMKGNIHKEKNMERENSHGQIIVHIQEISLITIFMEMVFTNGQMAEFFLEHGETIKWKDMVHSHGQMEENMLVNMSMI